jgi:cytochrome b561
MAHQVSEKQRYDSVAIMFHWVTAGLIVIAILLAWSVSLTSRGLIHANLLVLQRARRRVYQPQPPRIASRMSSLGQSLADGVLESPSGKFARSKTDRGSISASIV